MRAAGSADEAGGARSWFFGCGRGPRYASVVNVIDLFTASPVSHIVRYIERVRVVVESVHH
jgi:hypothetical protein